MVLEGFWGLFTSISAGQASLSTSGFNFPLARPYGRSLRIQKVENSDCMGSPSFS